MKQFAANTMTSRTTQLLARLIGGGLVWIAATLIGQQTLGAEEMARLSDLSAEIATLTIGVAIALWDLFLHKRATGGVMQRAGRNPYLVARVQSVAGSAAQALGDAERFRETNERLCGQNRALRERLHLKTQQLAQQKGTQHVTNNGTAGEATDGPTSPRPTEEE